MQCKMKAKQDDRSCWTLTQKKKKPFTNILKIKLGTKNIHLLNSERNRKESQKERVWVAEMHVPDIEIKVSIHTPMTISSIK